MSDMKIAKDCAEIKLGDGKIGVTGFVDGDQSGCMSFSVLSGEHVAGDKVEDHSDPIFLLITCKNIASAKVLQKIANHIVKKMEHSYCKEDDATCCADCKHYIRPADDVEDCGMGIGSPYGEWTQGYCEGFELLDVPNDGGSNEN